MSRKLLSKNTHSSTTQMELLKTTSKFDLFCFRNILFWSSYISHIRNWLTRLFFISPQVTLSQNQFKNENRNGLASLSWNWNKRNSFRLVNTQLSRKHANIHTMRCDSTFWCEQRVRMGWYVDCNVLGVCTTRVTIRIEGVYAKFPILLLTFIKCAISSRSRSHPNVGQCGCDAAHNITIYQQRAKRSHFCIQGKQLFFSFSFFEYVCVPLRVVAFIFAMNCLIPAFRGPLNILVNQTLSFSLLLQSKFSLFLRKAFVLTQISQ